MVLMCEGDDGLDPLLADVLGDSAFLKVEVFDGDRRVLVRLPQP